MGKALMIGALSTSTMGSGNEYNFFGYVTATATEASAQASATEDCTFTRLASRVIAGNSGTATFQFRDAGANGQNVTQITGVGTNEDATNSDALSAGDLFNLAYTDTGSNSTLAWTKMNVEFASGHGNFHGTAGYNGLVYDVASTTNFIGLGGFMVADGTGTEDDVGWKVRGYDTFEALQVRVIANARTNDSVFRNRINKADGTGVITFGSGVTGLLSDTAIGDAITDGQVVNASITLGTGVEDLTLAFVTGTFKSSTSKSETFAATMAALDRAASATASYHPIGGAMNSFTAVGEADSRIKPGFAGVASNLRCYLAVNTYTGDGTLKLMQNGTAVLTTMLTAAGGAAWYENTADSVSFDDNDEFSLEFDEGTSGSIRVRMAGLTFAPAAGAPAGQPYQKRLGGIPGMGMVQPGFSHSW